MRKGLIITIAVAILISVVSYFGYRIFVPPVFTIEKIDWINSSGEFSLGGQRHNFSNKVGSDNYKLPYGWSVIYLNENDKTVFKLFKNTVFVKTIGTVDFTNKTF